MKVTTEVRRDLKKYLLKRIKDGNLSRTIEVQTPYPLTDAEVEKFKNYFGKSSVEISNTIDSNLLGGFVLIDGTEKLDASLKGQLDAIVSSLLSK